MESITITAKIQVKTTNSDQVLLHQTMTTYRNACNFVSEYIDKTHNLKQRSLNDALYTTIREKFGLRSQMTQSVFKTVIAKYKSILENQNEWIKPNFKNLQYDLVWNRDYSLSKDIFSVNTLEGRIKLPYYKQAMERFFDSDVYQFGTAKLVYKKNKYYLHIPVTFDVDILDVNDISNIVGIDRGINFIVTTYDSKGKTKFVSGSEVKQKRSHYKKLRSQLQKVGTPSSRRRLKAIGQRENRWMQDVNHCITKALVDDNPKHTLFVLEDLTGIRNATEKVKRKDRYVSVSWSFYDLEQKLIYKAKQNGSEVIKIDPHYTSQTCPKCGHIDKNNRDKKNHLFSCKNCGYQSNDDRIGAMNIYRLGVEYVIKEQTKALIKETN